MLSGLSPVIVCCLASLAMLSAQTYTQISGAITDASGASVPGAMVTIIDEDKGFRRTAETRTDGGYLVSALQSGVYKITVRKAGFRTMILSVSLNDAQAARIDFKLLVGSMRETITVDGASPWINYQDASVGTLVGRELHEQLPVNSFIGLLELTPGVVVTPATRGEAGQFTVNGQRPNTHYFTVDGVSANSGVSGGGLPAQSTGGTLPAMTAFGSLDSTVSLDALQDVRVQTSTSGAEFGRLPGAQVSVNSRSGTNQFHGALLYAFRNEALDANDWFANQDGEPRARLRLGNLDASAGGPIRRNRTFFFLSYGRTRLSQPFVWREPVPSAAIRESSPVWIQPVLNLFAGSNGTDFGHGLAQWTGGISRPSELDLGSARLDHAVSSRLTVFGRYSDSASSTEFGSSPVNWLDLRSRGATAGVSFRATANLVSDLRVNWSKSNTSSLWRQAGSVSDCYLAPVATFVFGPSASCNYLVRFSIAGVGQVASGSEGWRSQSQFQIAGTTGFHRGNHSLRFGGDYRRLMPHREDASNTLSIITNSINDLTDRSSFWTAASPPRHISAVVQEASLFVQDTWQVTPRLTATFGLRWEISPAPDSIGPANYLDPAKGVVALQRPIWQSTYANFAPRAGLAYRLKNGGQTVIRAGGGLYFDSSLSLATDLVNDGPLSVSQYGSARYGFIASVLEFGFLPNLRLPLVKQWNASIEHAFGSHDTVSLGYAGSSGYSLIRREIGGAGSTNLTWLALATNHGSSEYHSLQVQYRRRLAKGLEGLASYAWSHSIDNSSTDGGLYWAGSGLTPDRDRATSDFDVRQTLTAGLVYQLRGWSLNGMFRARTGFPVNVLNARQYLGVNVENIFRPDLVGGQPVWIGGRINQAAFHAAPDSVQGNLGRNALSGFGMHQFDLALRKEFPLAEQRSIQVRVEAFNVFNHPNFADPIRFMANPLFGQSTSMLNLMLGTGSPGTGLAPMFQSGGSRTMQIVIGFRL